MKSSRLIFFLKFQPWALNGGSPQLPGPDNPYYAQIKKSTTILKTLICSTYIKHSLTWHLIYACQIWGQKEIMVRKLLQLQNTAMRLINFKLNDHPADALYHSNKILKVTDYIKLLSCLFVKNILARHCLSNFQGTFR